jgi:hypothetical protein
MFDYPGGEVAEVISFDFGSKVAEIMSFGFADKTAFNFFGFADNSTEVIFFNFFQL